jgi:MFS family permease
MADQKRLFTFEFVTLCMVTFFAFCNMSVFYSFFSYLGRIGVPAEWRGFLVGLEPMSAFALRLAVIPLIHIGNAAGVMILSLLMTIVALSSYTWAVTIPSLIALRIFHGAAFVLLVSASMAIVVYLIPKERSAQGFGIVSVTTLVPYAVMPLVTEALLPSVRTEAHIYAGVTLLAFPGIGLLVILRKRLGQALQATRASLARRPSLKDLHQNLRHPGVVMILGVNLLLYLCYATVFFFVKGYFKAIESGDPGRFFTIATVMMIAVRVVGGRFFDRLNKMKILLASVCLLIPWFLLVNCLRSPLMIYLSAGYYGLCIGIIFPLLNSVLYEVSPEQLRGLNTNLALFMMDSGFFLSPYAGGMLLAAGRSFAALFNICAGLLACAAGLLALLTRFQATRLEDTSAEVNE